MFVFGMTENIIIFHILHNIKDRINLI